MLLFAAPILKAQTSVDLDSDLGGRIAFSLDKKLVKGLHLAFEEEVRVDDGFTSLNRLQSTIGLTYKVNRYLKVGLGYVMINPYNSDSSAFKNIRHRFMADVTGSLAVGVWRISLKERFQATCRTGDINEYQAPRTALALKSRLKLQYRGFRQFVPYASVELRNTLNAPVIKAAYNETTGKWVSQETGFAKNEAGWFLDGFDGVYINRWRGAIGAEYKIDKKSSIDVSFLADFVNDKVVDANAEGTKLKSYTQEKGFVGWFTAGYTIMF